MSADLFDPAPERLPAGVPCPECAHPEACVFRFDCEGCNVRLVAQTPPAAAEMWMTDAIRPKVLAERERLAQQPEQT